MSEGNRPGGGCPILVQLSAVTPAGWYAGTSADIQGTTVKAFHRLIGLIYVQRCVSGAARDALRVDRTRKRSKGFRHASLVTGSRVYADIRWTCRRWSVV